ncbi:tetratricopeptide repeat protein [Candidatus Saganbacteria bacterium]|uniref:Tetratricopeptide repeat protein n=1 Tax=Candidatus Saganbacteria bacterium TaxID=2575572 RepID=A0A9D6UNA8_UNCSA|nr:tetratricopeptide repeat protein [Candidatus Saganbacteria bacterium]
MTLLSPIMSYIVDKEIGFPIPSEREKIEKAIRRYKSILSQHPERSDAPEIMFGIADLLVGRGEAGDHAEAMKLYDQILLRNPPEYLKARALVGKAELAIGVPEEFGGAISLCEKARQILKSDVSDFFASKTFIVEAELRLARRDKGDWANALELINRVVREKDAHWYFRGRALLSKAEIILYRNPDDLGPALKLVDFSLKELASRPDDYFTNKGKVLRAEILTRRDNKGDFERAEKLLAEVLKMSFTYKDLIGRAKLDLADIVSHPKAAKLLKEVSQMEGLDPYLIEKASLIEQALKERKK